MEQQAEATQAAMTGGVVGQINAAGGKVVAAGSVGTIVISPSGQEYRRVFAGVPAPGQSLVGRETILADLRRELLAGGLVARTGLPGVGKTALALGIARDDAILKHFAGGVLWAGLGPAANVSSVLARWGTMLGVDLGAEGTSADRAQRLHDHLQTVVPGKAILVVLDDAWEWLDLAPFRVFAEPGSALLVTTRDRELARKFTQQRPSTIQELDETASVALLGRLCPEAMIDPEGLRGLAVAVGGLPLALVLIGGELASNAGLPLWVRRAIERLKTAQARLALVDYQARPGMEGVSPSLQVVIEMSLSALSDDQARNAFARLAVFAAKPADFSREAALEVWELDEDEVDRCLRVLTHRNLLEITSGGRFALHQLMAQVARLHLGEQLSQVSGRHLNHYLTLVKRDPQDWQAIEAELPQVRQAWEWASATSGQDAQVLELIWAARLFMDRRGLWTTLLAWYERGLRAAHALGHVRDEGTLLNNIGAVHHRRGELDQALDYYEHALSIRRELGHRAGEAITLNNIGLLHSQRRELDEALDYYEQVLPIRREVGDRAGEATTLTNIGVVHTNRGELDKALDYYEQALPIRREAGDRAGEAATLNNIGIVHKNRGELDKALGYYEQALLIGRAVGDRAGEALTHFSIGMLHKSRGDLVAAVAAFERAVALDELIAHPDLDGDRKVLEQVRNERDAATP